MEVSLMDGHAMPTATTPEDSDTFHTAEEWEHWRSLITRLHFTEDTTLKVVRKTLADQYDFRAT